MKEKDPKRCCLAKAEDRRRQVLEAASDCFRRHGFHAASMAEIAKQARMSPGHIYNYFKSKEEIIEAIVQQDIDETLCLMDELEQGSQDSLEALVSRVGLGVERHTDPENSALMLEVMAEASRNPKVMRMVSQADRTVREHMRTLLLASHKGDKFQADQDLDGRVEILSALFNGLMICALINPSLDRASATRVLRQAVSRTLDLD